MTITKEEVRLEKLCASFKALLLDFPVLSRADIKVSFRQYTDAELDAAVASLAANGFITLAKGPRGGERYVRSLGA